jgi:hypothetical protein
MYRPVWGDCWRFARVALLASAFMSTVVPPVASAEAAGERAAVDTYLRHIYSIYFGLRACFELSAELKDRSYEASVTFDEARAAMRKIENAATEAGFATDPVWSTVAPQALVTASALKRSPERHAICSRMGDLFENDEANLQNLLGRLGARQAIIPKGF